MRSQPTYPAKIESDIQLLELLIRPSAALIESIRQISGPLLVLGAGGKMGPTLCVLARNAAREAGHSLAITAVSRFSDVQSREWLELQGIKTVSADLLDRTAVQTLPDAPNVINLTGLKFGTKTNPALTWATNTVGPMLIAERYAKSRIVALSTGNVYPRVPVADGGAREDHALTPLGEYANAAVARERVFEYFSQLNGTAMALMRLFFAVELRYGVLVDIARRVWDGQPIDVTNGWFNCIWQGDANEMILRAFSLASSPASVWNLSHPKPLKVRTAAEQFGKLLERPVHFTGNEAPDSLICNADKLCTRLGEPATPLETVMEWIANWIQRGGTNWNKSTGFEVRDGSY
ncbi:NAD-dependent epimerase/dehydratase family protein [bacterium]|nr:NAD-dependent epimerase/dehydratase family protein [bacterium]